MSARIYLEDELQAVLAQAKNKLEHASKLLSSTEANVKQAIKAHQVPTEVNGVGVEGYQAAGVLIAEAIAILTTLGADASTGLVFPVIVATGSPATFDRVRVNTVDHTGDKGTIEAYASLSGGLPTYPFGSGSDVLAAGDKLRITKCAFDLDQPGKLPSSLEGFTLEIHEIGTVPSDDIDGDDYAEGRPRVVFNEMYAWYNEGASEPTVVSAADSTADRIGRVSKFEARVVYR